MIGQDYGEDVVLEVTCCTLQRRKAAGGYRNRQVPYDAKPGRKISSAVTPVRASDPHQVALYD